MFFRMPLFLLGLLFFGQVFAHSEVQSKIVYGYLEKAVLPDKQLLLKAKLDTGAKSASLYAKRIRYVDIKGKSFLQFVVPTKTGDVPFTCAHVGDVSIKARSGEIAGVRIKNPFIRRPVVNMPIQLGHETRTIRVNLANRRRFTYPLLLGREALVAFNGVVDPEQKFTLNKTVMTR
ncbi:MAG: RimK/LysX family protein [Gammaproteobacteria bacterium]|nr:RimK/LysX family protein [Gammaproteobacteria bacterium]